MLFFKWVLMAVTSQTSEMTVTEGIFQHLSLSWELHPGITTLGGDGH